MFLPAKQAPHARSRVSALLESSRYEFLDMNQSRLSTTTLILYSDVMATGEKGQSQVQGSREEDVAVN